MSELTPQAEPKTLSSKLMRGAIWIAIGSLIAAALVCVVWVLVGNQDGIIGRAFLTILLLAAFAGIAIVESNLAERRPEWLVLASMISWIIVLLVGAIKIWLPEPDRYGSWGIERFFQFLAVIAIVQLALVHARLFLSASQRYVTTFTRVIMMVTFAMMALLVAMLVFFLTFPDQLDYNDLYWRIVIALAILAAVGTTLIPLLNALFAPRAPRAQGVAPQGVPPQQAQQQAWPTYADGRTPLPVMPDGSPDWNAYYTGYPTYAAQPQAPVPAQSFPVVDAGQQVPYSPAQDAGQPASAPQAPYAPEPTMPAPPAAPGAPDPAQGYPVPQSPAAPEAPREQFAPPAPTGPPVPPNTHGSVPPPPPAMLGGNQ